MGHVLTMRWILLPSILLVSILLLAACGGGDGQPAGPIIQDPEAVALQISEIPAALVPEGEGGIHVSNEEACASAADEVEKQACIERLNTWGRRDHYQVLYTSTDANPILSGVFEILVGVSVYDTVAGAAASFDYNANRLRDIIKDNPDASLVEAEQVGDESVAWVSYTTEELISLDVPIATYVVDFRRGNTIVRAQAAIARALGKGDEAVEWARKVDDHILRVSTQQLTAASPEPSSSVTP